MANDVIALTVNNVLEDSIHNIMDRGAIEPVNNIYVQHAIQFYGNFQYYDTSNFFVEGGTDINS